MHDHAPAFEMLRICGTWLGHHFDVHPRIPQSFNQRHLTANDVRVKLGVAKR